MTMDFTITISVAFLHHAKGAVNVLEKGITLLFVKIRNYLFNKRLKKSKRIDEDPLYYVLLEGQARGFNINSIDEVNPRPDWLDEEKIKRGQEFAMENFPSICMTGMIALYLLFADENSIGPLVYTNKSSSVLTACRRYLSTIIKVKSWYQTDLLAKDSQGYKYLEKVFNFHLTVQKKLNSLTKEERKEKTLLWKWISRNEAKSSLCPFLLKDVKSSGIQRVSMPDNSVSISQSHMGATQFGFMGLVILYPAEFGISCRENLEDFVHLWRYIGHMLGIEDRFNLCSGSLEQVENKMRFLLDCLLKPLLADASESWEHMSRVMTEGVNLYTGNMSFEVSLVYLLKSIGINTSNIMSSFSWTQYLRYHICYVTFRFLLKIKWIRRKCTKVLLKSIDKANSDFSKIAEKYNKLM